MVPTVVWSVVMWEPGEGVRMGQRLSEEGWVLLSCGINLVVLLPNILVMWYTTETLNVHYFLRKILLNINIMLQKCLLRCESRILTEASIYETNLCKQGKTRTSCQ